MDIIKQFNLPSYVKGKSFSEASKFIAKKFEGRNSPEDVATLNDLQGRLQQAQEFIKQQNQKLSQPQEGNNFNYGGQMGPGDPKPKSAYPANPNDLISSFKNNQEGLSYSNPYPNRSNRWELFDSYQKGLSNKTMNTGNVNNIPAEGRDAFTGKYGFDAEKIKSELNYEKKLNKRNVVTEADKLKMDNKSIASSINSNSFDGGGLMSLLGGAGGAASGVAGGAGSVMGAVTGGLDLANRVFGDTGVDTSGRTAGPKVNMGGEIAGGAMSGAQLGGAIAPGIGHAIGAIGGGILGSIGGKRKINDASEANFGNAVMKNNELANKYNEGGYLGFDGGRDLKPKAKALDISGLDLNSLNDPMTARALGLPEQIGLRDPRTARGLNLKGVGLNDPRTARSLNTSGLNKATNGLNDVVTGTPDENVANNTGGLAERRIPGQEQTNKTFNPFSNLDASALRYAPAAMNLAQLASLEKPSDVAFDRLNTKYDKQLVDEQGLQNTVRQATASNRDALLSSSGGSGSKARAALLASQLQGTKALSQAYQQAGAENRQEGRREQDFNLGVAKTNLQQGNLAKQVNLQRDAAYQTNRSKLLSELGNDLGGMGREELFKKYPEMMGLGYDSKGNKITQEENTEFTANDNIIENTANAANSINPSTNPDQVDPGTTVGSTKTNVVEPTNTNSIIDNNVVDNTVVDKNAGKQKVADEIKKRIAGQTIGGISNKDLNGVNNLDLSNDFSTVLDGLQRDEGNKAYVKSKKTNRNPKSNYDPNNIGLSQDEIHPSQQVYDYNKKLGQIEDSNYVNKKDEFVKTNLKDFYGKNVEINKEIEPNFNKALDIIKGQGLNLSVADSHVRKDVKVAAKKTYDKNLAKFKKDGFYINNEGLRVNSAPAKQAGAKSFHTSGKAFDLNQKAYNPNSAKFLAVKQALIDSGFKQHPGEWWHFSVGEFD